MSRVSPRSTAFPWRDGNAFRLHSDAEAFYPHMLAAIDQASESILLEMYLVSSGQVANRFIDTLCAAADRGVDVYVLLDDFGARSLGAADREQLQRHRVQLSWYNPLKLWRFRGNLSRDHRKLLLVDGKRAFTGGVGITDAFTATPDGTPGWRDTVVEIQGPVVQDWQQLFRSTWNRCTALPMRDDTPATSVPVGSSPGRVNASAERSGKSFIRSLIRQALRADQRIWIATAYFIPSRRLRRTLALKARHGVDVRLLLPGPITDHPGVRYASHGYYGTLLRNGVRIFEYQPSFLHTKLALCDHWVSIGSSNFDRWNLRRNLEANQEIDDAALAATAQALFESDLLMAREITPDQLLYRSWYVRLRNRFWSWMERLLDRDD